MNTPDNSRDMAALHRQMIAQRGVEQDMLDSWEEYNQSIELNSRYPVPMAPPWAYDYYGGLLRETPLLPSQSGFQQQHFSQDDIEEERMIIRYESQKPGQIVYEHLDSILRWF